MTEPTSAATTHKFFTTNRGLSESGKNNRITTRSGPKKSALFRLCTLHWALGTDTRCCEVHCWCSLYSWTGIIVQLEVKVKLKRCLKKNSYIPGIVKLVIEHGNESNFEKQYHKNCWLLSKVHQGKIWDCINQIEASRSRYQIKTDFSVRSRLLCVNVDVILARL